MKRVPEQLFVNQTLLTGKVDDGGGGFEDFLVLSDVNAFVFVDSIQNIWCYFSLCWLLSK